MDDQFSAAIAALFARVDAIVSPSVDHALRDVAHRENLDQDTALQQLVLWGYTAYCLDRRITPFDQADVLYPKDASMPLPVGPPAEGSPSPSTFRPPPGGEGEPE